MRELTQGTYFDSIATGIAVVDIGAAWCPDCRRIEPIMNALENEYKDIQFFTVDFSKEEQLKDTLNIQRIPTLIFYKNGEEVGQRLVEPHTRAIIEKEIQGLLG
ncbi:thioredoxin [Helicobacter aurati]|uniref:Thioredoxin n=1 Tax=Helicobacter aurati TaxID=137778 RepID=A0A3D8J9X0_9HELI|nr:thioredoxin family protein [Helicobacter aurati]RDU73664.1 thioredoxin [Helicobacter aurati]